MTNVSARPNPFVAFGQLRPELMGVVFHIAWLFLLMFYAPAASQVCFPGTDVSLFYFISFLALAATAVVFIVTPRGFLDVCYSRHGVFLAGCITTAGTALYCAAQASPQIPLIAGAGVLTGIGSCMVASLWAAAFARMSPRQVCANLPCILALTIVTCIDVCFVPYQVYFVAVIAAALLSMVVLAYAVESLGKGDLELKLKPGVHENKGVSPSQALVALVITILLLGILEGLLTVFSNGAVWVFTDAEEFFYALLGIIIFASLGAFLYETNRADLLPLFVVPVLAVAAFLVPAVCQTGLSGPDIFYTIGLVSQELVLIAGTVAVSILFKMPPIRTFLIARIAFGVSDLAGQIVGTYAAGSSLSGDTGTGVIVFALCELAIALMILIFVLLHRYNTTYSDDDKPVAADSSNAQIADTCEKLAVAYNLSPRERDVFLLLAEGRSAARVCEELCIAEGTVNTHTRNIYNKLDVHTRQEMLDLVYGKNS